MSNEPALTTQETTRFRHPEAYCLVRYYSVDSDDTLTVWNTRDGAMPLKITIEGRIFYQDLDHHLYAPNHQPMPGDMVVVDATADERVEYRRKWVEANWDNPSYPYDMKTRFSSKEQAVEIMARIDAAGDGLPLVRVFKGGAE